MKKEIFVIAFLLLFHSFARGEQKALIEVSTQNQTMLFSVRENGQVAFLYWGDRIGDIASFDAVKYKNQPDTRDEFISQLYPSYGGRYYLNPALAVVHHDGSLTTELVYDSHQQTTLDTNRTETVVRLKDKLYPITVDIRFIAYQQEDVITQSVALSHRERGTIRVEQLASSFFPLHAESYYLTHFHGTWAAEMQLEEEQLTHGVKAIESKKGTRTTQAENPAFLLSLNHPSQEDYGMVYAGALAWSGNYKVSFELDERGVLNVLGGMNPFASSFVLEPGKELTTPDMVLACSSKGRGELSRNLHDWSRRYALQHGNDLRPVILNSWEGAYFDFDEQTITTMIDDAAAFGVEMFVLDDGWFGNKYPRNGDNAGLGDWQVNKKKLPRGISYLADYAVSKGVKFGIWIEPEMVNPDSDLAKRHPEWVVQSGKRDKLPMRNEWVLDLSNPQVQDFVFHTFDEVVSLSPHISYIKWDANRHVDNVGSTYLSADKQSHFWYEYVNGLYRVYERIREKYPHIIIQLCSSGGGRLDYGALKYHDEFWASDNTNAIDRLYIQYGSNLFFPAIATASHVSTSPNHQTDMMIPLKFRFDVAMSGRLGMELQPKDIVGEEYRFAKQAIDCYKQIRPIVQLGDLYRMISPYDPNGWVSHMYVDKEKKKAVFFAYSLKYHGRTTYFETTMKGLDPDKQYKVTELNRQGGSVFSADGCLFSGEYLMKAGVILNIGNAFSSAVLLVEEQ